MDVEIEQMLDKYEKEFNRLSKLFSGYEEVVVFGAGEYGKKILDLLYAKNIKVVSFLDNDENKENLTLGGVAISRPSADIISKYPIFIASTWYSEIYAQLSEYENIKIINESDIDMSFYNILSSKKSLTKSELQTLKWLYGKLEDKSSRDILSSILNYRVSGMRSALHVSDHTQYFHPEVHPALDETVLDVGAWQGDSVDDFLDAIGAKGLLVSFEPDISNYKILQDKIKLLNNSNVQTHNLGAWNEESELKFASSNRLDGHLSLGCNINENGDCVIKVTSLDIFCSKNQIAPDFIKMDIEGAEKEAILGAKEIIKKYKPKLAISIYHKYNDLWELPKLVHDIRDDYEFFLGHHHDGWTETVLYAG